MISIVELRHLRYFVAVAEELHFGRAARRLHVSQPPLSQQIRALEETLRVRLFERTSRAVTLTPAGEALLRRSRDLFRQLDDAVAHTQRSARGDVGVLKVGFSSAAAMGPLPIVLATFRRQHPAIAIELTESNSPSLVRALIADRVDVALLATPLLSTVSVDTLTIRPIARERLTVVLPARHPLARLRRVPLTRLADEPLVTMQPEIEPGWSRAMGRVLSQHGVAGRVVLETDSKLSLLALVAAGMGVSIVGESLAALRTRGVAFRPVTFAKDGEPPPDLELAVAWRRDDLSPLIEKLVACCPTPRMRRASGG
jgi:DNA-binding transcriptional LysR family regulator